MLGARIPAGQLRDQVEVVLLVDLAELPVGVEEEDCTIVEEVGDAAFLVGEEEVHFEVGLIG